MGSGDEATGVSGCDLTFGAATTLRGTVNLYGCTLRQTVGAVSWTPSAALTGEAINCLFQSSAAAASPFVLGSSAVSSSIDNMYNVDFSHTLASSFAMTNFFVGTAKRITIGAPTPANLISSGSASISVTELACFGTPSQSDLRWNGAGAVAWTLVRPRFTGAVAKFSASASAAGSLADVNSATVEYWFGLWKMVNELGDGVSGIPIKVTDAYSNVQINTTSDTNGEITYGSGTTVDCLAVMDHYCTAGGVYIQRYRGPFLVEVNLPSMTGYNSAYLSHRYYADVPGSEGVTTTSGSFADIGDFVQMRPISGNPTLWTEQVL